jgi:hypothetical protein
MTEPSRRFPAPWRPDRIPGGYDVRDATGQIVAWVYTRASTAEAMQAKVLPLDEARRIATNIARLPELLTTSYMTGGRAAWPRVLLRAAGGHACWLLVASHSQTNRAQPSTGCAAVQPRAKGLARSPRPDQGAPGQIAPLRQNVRGAWGDGGNGRT